MVKKKTNKDKGEIIVGLIIIKETKKFNEKLWHKAQKKADDTFNKIHGKDTKAAIWVCPRLDNGDECNPFSKKGKCKHCRHRIVYDPELKTKFTKDVKKICSYCMLNVKKYSKELNEEEKEILQ